jgi:hypothetical protein
MSGGVFGEDVHLIGHESLCNSSLFGPKKMIIK